MKWYDHAGRDLPWRIKGGKTQDPYKAWLAEIMLQQTGVKTVIPYYLKFLKKWPSVEKLAKAKEEDVLREWAGLGYYARARNLLKCARAAVQEHGGKFPEEEAALRKLPGIGLYTAAAIRAIAFQKPANVVDGNIERVMARLHAVKTKLPEAKPKLYKMAAGYVPQKRPGDYAQALMDLGATICTPDNPQCSACPVSKFCKAFAKDEAEKYPVKAAKKASPQKYGHVYWLVSEKGVLCERRGGRGLLAGMVGLPTTDWLTELPKGKPPVKTLWKKSGAVEHSFTHFDLTLQIWQAFLPLKDRGDYAKMRLSNRYFWIHEKDIKNAGLPTLFKKVLPYTLGAHSVAASSKRAGKK